MKSKLKIIHTEFENHTLIFTAYSVTPELLKVYTSVYVFKHTFRSEIFIYKILLKIKIMGCIFHLI